MKSASNENAVVPEPNMMQRRIAGLMTNVRNSKGDYIVRVLDITPSMINETNIEGRTLMHSACINEKKDMVELLLKYNPDLTLKDKYGLTAIHYAAYMKLNEVYSLIAQYQGIDNVEAIKAELTNEVVVSIPSFNMERGMYSKQVNGEAVYTQDITHFFPVEKEEKSDGTVILHPLPSYICIFDNTIYTLKYCTICHIYSPPRSYHCRYCEVCIRNFDHHCPWVSNCVGLRNHKYFLWFLVSSDVCCLYGAIIMGFFFYLSIVGWFTKSMDIISYLLRIWSEVVYLVACLGFFFPMANLVWYHTSITSKNVTTHEDVMISLKEKKEHPEKNFYPYSKGLYQNLKIGYCMKTPSSSVQLLSV